MLKKLPFICAFLACPLFASNLQNIDSTQNAQVVEKNLNKEYSFGYTSMGVLLPIFPIPVPEVTVGYRTRSGNRAFDYSCSVASLLVVNKISPTFSYLRYTNEENRYFGFGLELDVLPYYSDRTGKFQLDVIPLPVIIFGKEYEDKRFNQWKIGFPYVSFSHGF